MFVFISVTLRQLEFLMMMSLFVTVEVGQTLECYPEDNRGILPWVSPTDRTVIACYSDVTPGQFVLRTLFTEFTVLAEKKIDLILSEPLVSLALTIKFAKPPVRNRNDLVCDSFTSNQKFYSDVVLTPNTLR